MKTVLLPKAVANALKLIGQWERAPAVDVPGPVCSFERLSRFGITQRVGRWWELTDLGRAAIEQMAGVEWDCEAVVELPDADGPR